MKRVEFFEEVMALEVRFGKRAVRGVKEALDSITSLDCFSELLRLAIKCGRLSDFGRALEQDRLTWNRP